MYRTIHNLQNVTMNSEQLNENDRRSLIAQLNALNQSIESQRSRHLRAPLTIPTTSHRDITTSYRDIHSQREPSILSPFSFNIPSLS